jgi:hypothetical protein
MEQRIAKVGGVITLEKSWELPRLSLGTRAAWLRFGTAVGLGLLITLGQVALACYLSRQTNLRQAYFQLWMWDGSWYASIAHHGYIVPEMTPGVQGNTAMFPAYPLFARGLMELCGLEVRTALLLAAQLAAWGFWVYVLLFLQRWRLPASLRAIGLLLIATHPASFFLVASYTESLFLFGLLGFLYWAEVPRWSTGFLAGVHGILMTGARMVGVPLVFVPLVGGMLSRPRQEMATATGSLGRESMAPALNRAGSWLKRLMRGAFIAVLASLGAGAFFMYCHYQLGQWDIYMKTAQQGWGIESDYLGLFSSRIFRIGRPNWHEFMVDPDFLSRLSVPLMLVTLAGFFLTEFWLARTQADSGWRGRLPFYLCAALLFYVSVSGHVGRHMSSMLRFSLCVHVPLVLALVHLLSRSWPLHGWSERVLTIFVTAWTVICFGLQVLLTYRFTHGMWVA